MYGARRKREGNNQNVCPQILTAVRLPSVKGHGHSSSPVPATGNAGPSSVTFLRLCDIIMNYRPMLTYHITYHL